MFAEYRLNRRQGISGNYCRSTRTEYKRRPRRESRRGQRSCNYRDTTGEIYIRYPALIFHEGQK